MSKTYKCSGAVLDAVAAAAVTSGDLVLIGSLVGVALGSAAIGEAYRAKLDGVFEVAKLSTDVVTVGAPLYLDAANKRVTLDDNAGANKLAGHAFTAAGNGVATVQVRLQASV